MVIIHNAISRREEHHGFSRWYDKLCCYLVATTRKRENEMMTELKEKKTGWNQKMCCFPTLGTEKSCFEIWAENKEINDIGGFHLDEDECSNSYCILALFMESVNFCFTLSPLISSLVGSLA